MILLVLSYLAFAVLGLRESLLGASWPLMAGDLHAALTDAGTVSLVMSLATILASLVSHRVLRRFGMQRTTGTALSVMGIALVGIACAPSLGWVVGWAALLGIGPGLAEPSINYHMAANHSAASMSGLHCSWGVGALASPLLIAQIHGMGSGGWRAGYRMIAVMQLCAAVLFFLASFFAKRTAAPALGMQQEESPPVGGMLSILRKRGAVWVAVSVVMCCALETTIALWGTSYLVQARGLSGDTAARWLSAFFVGITASRLACGLLAHSLKAYRLILCGIGVVMCGLVMLLLLRGQNGGLAAFILLGAGIAPIYPTILHQVPVYFGAENTQAAMSVISAITYSSITLLPFASGLLFARVSFEQMPLLLLGYALLLLLAVCRRSANSSNGQG